CAAHQAGIVHRDIKPGNIMLRTDGIVKVLDFGLATLAEQKSDDLEAATLVKTKEGIVMGTPHYMSPEQARGQKMDSRTDIFSLGVVLYEIVTGRAPFEGETPSDILVSVLEKEPPSLTTYRSEAPDELQEIIARALTKKVSERYQTSAQLLGALRALKDKLDFETKFPLSSSTTSRRTVAAAHSAPPAAASRGTAIEAGHHAPPTTPSAEYFVNQIKRHKTGAVFITLIFALAIAAASYVLPARNRKPIDSLAVLPFVNANGDPNTEYLSDGLTESIIYSSSQLPNLRVTPRSSVFSYKGKEANLQTVARDLGVAAVVTGRVIQHGDELFISAELVDVRDNRLLWGQQYTRKMTAVLVVQEEIAKEISEKLRARLTNEEKSRVTKRYTDNPEAYQLYLKGRYYWSKRTRDGYEKATEQFEQAIQKDPNYALAYAGVADCYNVLPSYGILSPREAFPKARTAVTRALEIDGKLAEAHTSLAYLKGWFDWDLAGAESEYRRAIELNPNYTTAHQWLALQLAQMGRMQESVQEIKLAQDLDPLSLIVNINAGWIFYQARQYDQAIEQDRKSLDLDPNFARGHWAISEPLEQQKKYDEAIAELQKARQLDETPIMLALLAHVYAMTRKQNEARKIVGELIEQSKRMYVDPFFLAEIYVALGDRERAFQALEDAYQQRSSWMVWLNVEPKFDPVRNDPRFKEMQRRVGLTP
ncbi:MAG: protein kinase, partial [Pyrinomonadaceae bacterium]